MLIAVTVEAFAPEGTARGGGGAALEGGGGGGTFARGIADIVVVVVVFGAILIFVALLRCVTGVVCGLAFCFIFLLLSVALGL